MANVVTRLWFLTVSWRKEDSILDWKWTQANELAFSSTMQILVNTHNADTCKHPRSDKMCYSPPSPAYKQENKKQSKKLLLAPSLSSMIKGGRAQLWCREGKPSKLLWTPEDMWVFDRVQRQGNHLPTLLRNRRQFTMISKFVPVRWFSKQGSCCQLDDLSTPRIYTVQKGEPTPTSCPLISISSLWWVFPHTYTQQMYN